MLKTLRWPPVTYRTKLKVFNFMTLLDHHVPIPSSLGLIPSHSQILVQTSDTGNEDRTQGERPGKRTPVRSYCYLLRANTCLNEGCGREMKIGKLS